jgi:hypothetical protein
MIAMACTGVFAALIITNYVIQTTVVPALIHASNASASGTIAASTMSNPESIGWTLEMWGYAILGVATWLMAPAVRSVTGSPLAARLFAFNGPLSIAGVIATIAVPGWMLTQPGLLAFALWNLVVIAMSATIVIAIRAQMSQRPLRARLEVSS